MHVGHACGQERSGEIVAVQIDRIKKKGGGANSRDKLIAYVMYAKPKSAAAALGLHKSVFGGKVPPPPDRPTSTNQPVS